MRRWIPGFIAAILLLSAPTAWAKDPKAFAQEFFSRIQEGNIDGAYDGLFEGSGIPEMKPQAVDLLKRQTASALPLYGSVLGFELIHEEAFGRSVVRLVYVLEQKKVPTVWQFYFYKPEDQWFLGHVFFNDQFQNLQKLK